MSVRKLKPITPGQRFRIVNNFEEITTNKPEKSLTVVLVSQVDVTKLVK